MMSSILNFLPGFLGSLILLLAVFRNSSDRKVQYFVSYCIYYLSILIAFFVSVPQSLFRPRNIKNLRLASTVTALCADFMNIKWTLRNPHRIPKDLGAVVVSNHQSIFDVIGVAQLWDCMGDCTAILKKELLYIPGIGLWGWLLGLVFINRKNPKDAIKAIENASRLMETEKAKLWIFPEGTRGDGKNLLPFKIGAFVTAIRTQKPIIPVVFSPYRAFIDFENKLMSEDRRMTISVLQEVPTLGLTENDATSLMSEIKYIIEEEFEKLKAEAEVAEPLMTKMNESVAMRNVDPEDESKKNPIVWAGGRNNHRNPPSFAGYNQKFR